MWLNYFYIILIAWSLLCADSNYLQNTSADESLDKLKELSNFASWPGKNGPIRDGLNLSKCTIPNLSGTEEMPPKTPFSLRYTEEGEYLIQYRSRWQIASDNFIDVTMTFAATCEAAHEYVIRRFYDSQMPFKARIAKKDEPVIAGDISF